MEKSGDYFKPAANIGLLPWHDGLGGLLGQFKPAQPISLNSYLNSWPRQQAVVVTRNFMSDLFHKYNWLQVAFAEQVDRINECFYFDRQDNEFYSVFITDYLLIDKNYEADYPNNPYSGEELLILRERMERQKNKATSILPLPRLTIEERKHMMQAFLNSQIHLSNQEILQNIVDTENGRTNLDFSDALEIETKKRWQPFKENFIRQKIDSFCNLHGIDIEMASIWTEKKMTRMDLDLTDNKKAKATSTKPWWKLW